jgi:POT family proton-dependent oligopeptide transporter
MAKFRYKTTPTLTEKAPPGIWHILTNECAERFAYYGFTLILTEFMIKHLVGGVMSEGNAISWYHIFKCVTYLLPLVGAVIADLWFGKYRTIIFFSILYCFGLLFMTIDQSRIGLFSGMIFVAIGSGFIKPCVSANVGDQFGKSNQHLIVKFYNWFYFSINIGAFIGPFTTPKLMNSPNFGPKWAFGLAFVWMVFALIAFWMGRKLYVHVPPTGKSFVKGIFSGEGLNIIKRITILFVILSAFYCLYELTGSAWIIQVEKLNKHWLGYNWESSQVPSFNALFVLILIPIFTYVVYPVLNKFFRLNALRKMIIGMFFLIIPFLIIVWLEYKIRAGLTPSVGWQFLANFLLTAAEVFVSIPCLEFAYTQAPKWMKSFIMSLYLAASIGLGNLLTFIINNLIKDREFFKGPNYYWTFIIFMFVSSIIFAIFAVFYKGKTYTQDENDSSDSDNPNDDVHTDMQTETELQ